MVECAAGAGGGGKRAAAESNGRRLRLYEKIYSTFNERAHRAWAKGEG